MKALIFSLLTFLTSLWANERIIFHHIPKTGGTSLRELIDSHHTSDQICHDYIYYQIDKRRDLQKFKLLRGHFFYSQLKSLPGKRITFLRDPVKLVLSASRYKQQKFRNHPKRFSKLHFIPPGNPLKSMRNHQCHFLSSFDPRNKKISDQQHLESAKQNLNAFFFVGITEDIDIAASILLKMLGYPPIEKVPHKMQTRPPQKAYSEKLIQEIRERNWADIELYNYAKELYLTKFKTEVAENPSFG